MMVRTPTCILLSIAAALTAPIVADAQVAPPAQGAVAFVNVNVLPMDRETVLRNQTVVVRNGRIERIAPSATLAVPQDVQVVDARNKYLMPGLAEFHAHVPGAQSSQALKDRVLTLYVVNGITTARSMLGDTSHLSMRARIRDGQQLGPRIIAAGPSFSAGSIRSPQDAIDSVTSQKRQGYDLLKIHPGWSRAAYDSMVATAKRLSIPYAGHVPFDVGWTHATSTGYATIDHNDGLIEAMQKTPPQPQQVGFFGFDIIDSVDESKLPSLVKQAKDGRVWLVPTAALLDNWIDDTPAAVLAARPEMKYWVPSQVNNWTLLKNNTVSAPNYSASKARRFVDVRRRALRAMHQAGVPILLGSDAPQVWNVPGFSAHRELAALVDAGLTPYEALRTGTVNVARFLGEASTSGTVAQGKVADLILLDANPLENIANSQRISGVMVQGRWLSKADIDSKLAALAN